MTLATYLIAMGHAPTLRNHGESKSGYPIGAWEFENNQTLKGAVNGYNEGLAKVEPKMFHNTLTSTRRSLFKFLGIGVTDAASD